MSIEEILKRNNPEEIKSLFTFTLAEDDETILFKFNLWSRYFFPKYFSSPDAPFHHEIDLGNLSVYRGTLTTFVDIAFRGAAKTVRTKLFRGFVICNDQDRFRKFLKVESDDLENAKQFITDVYNMCINNEVLAMYPEIFKKTSAKREERMDSFTTSTGVKLTALTVGTSQRGAVQEEARPDEILFEDFETRNTLRSGRQTKNIWENMEEARTGLAKGGGCVYNCNYISEQGNVHTLVTKDMSNKKVLIVPILDEAGEPTWNRYTKLEIEQMKQDDDDFEGERMCKPSRARDIFFDRDSLEKMQKRLPLREVGGMKLFYEFDASHRYGSGHDIAGGVGLDSTTSVFIDFSVIPCRVVATFKSNSIKPDTMGDEIKRESDMYGGSIAGIEKNNHGHATIARAKQLEVNLYFTQPKDTAIFTTTAKEYGWHTNAASKPKMLFDFAKAIQDGLIDCVDPDLIAEAMAYTRNDLIDSEADPRLTTRHFDLLIAACIAYQMKDFAQVNEDAGQARARMWLEENRNLKNNAR